MGSRLVARWREWRAAQLYIAVRRGPSLRALLTPVFFSLLLVVGMFFSVGPGRGWVLAVEVFLLLLNMRTFAGLWVLRRRARASTAPTTNNPHRKP